MDTNTDVETYSNDQKDNLTIIHLVIMYFSWFCNFETEGRYKFKLKIYIFLYVTMLLMYK